MGGPPSPRESLSCLGNADVTRALICPPAKSMQSSTRRRLMGANGCGPSADAAGPRPFPIEFGGGAGRPRERACLSRASGRLSVDLWLGAPLRRLRTQSLPQGRREPAQIAAPSHTRAPRRWGPRWCGAGARLGADRGLRRVGATHEALLCRRARGSCPPISGRQGHATRWTP